MSDIYVIINTETSGLNSNKNCVLRLSALILDMNLNVLDVFDSYVKPFEGAVIEGEALTINGVTKEQYENAPTETEVFNKFTRLLRQPKYNSPTYVGYNIQFPISFLKGMAFRNKLQGYGNGMLIDLQMLTNDTHGLFKYSIKGAAEALGVSIMGIDGLSKCKTMLEIFKKATGS